MSTTPQHRSADAPDAAGARASRDLPRPRRDRPRRAAQQRARAAGPRRPQGARVMAVVKADGYGHGRCRAHAPAPARARPGWARPRRTRRSRCGRPASTRRCCAGCGRPAAWRAAVDADVDVAVSGLWALDEVTEAARAAGRPARIQLACRHRARPQRLPARRLAAHGGRGTEGAGRRARADHRPVVALRVRRRARAPVCERPTGAQFHDMLEYAEKAGSSRRCGTWPTPPPPSPSRRRTSTSLRTGGPLRHLARPGAGHPADFGLRPVMRLSAHVASVKQAPPGLGISYGHHYVTDRDTHLALVPVGYADGVPRHASGRGPVLLGGKVRTAAGRIAMDQFVVDLGEDTVRVGDRAVLFGSRRRRRAHGRGLGAGRGHHRVRDRDPRRHRACRASTWTRTRTRAGTTRGTTTGTGTRARAGPAERTRSAEGSRGRDDRRKSRRGGRRHRSGERWRLAPRGLRRGRR